MPVGSHNHKIYVHGLFAKILKAPCLLRQWMTDCIQMKIWHAITHPYRNSSVVLAILTSKLRFARLIDIIHILNMISDASIFIYGLISNNHILHVPLQDGHILLWPLYWPVTLLSHSRVGAGFILITFSITIYVHNYPINMLVRLNTSQAVSITNKKRKIT